MKISCTVIRMGHRTRHGRLYSMEVFEEIVRQAIGLELYGALDDRKTPMESVLDEKTADFRVKNVRLEGDVLVADVDALSKKAKSTFISEEMTLGSGKLAFLSLSPVLHADCDEGGNVKPKGLVLQRVDITASPAYWEMVEMQREQDRDAENELRQKEGRKPLPPLPIEEKPKAPPKRELTADEESSGFGSSGFKESDTADEKFLDLPSDFSVDEESS